MKLRSNMLLVAAMVLIGGLGLTGCSDALLNPADNRVVTERADESAGKVWERLRGADPIGLGDGLGDAMDSASSDSTDTQGEPIGGTSAPK